MREHLLWGGGSVAVSQLHDSAWLAWRHLAAQKEEIPSQGLD